MQIQFIIILLSLITFQLNAQRKSFSSNGLLTSYETFGQGYPVLIINGGPGMSSNGFEELAKLLSEKNTTIIYDQRGTGESIMPEINRSSMTLELLTEDIENLRKHLGYEQWIVLGHSFGGMLAYEYASRFPERVKAMIQSHSGGMDVNIREEFDVRRRLSKIQQDSLNYYAVQMSLGDDSRSTALKRAEYLALAYVNDPGLAKGIAPRLTESNRIINSYVWNNLRSIPFDRTENLKNFHKPVLLLHGDNDIVPLKVAQKAHNILPNSRLIIIPDCGHYGWLEKPEIYIQEVKYFLNTNSSDSNP